MIARGSVAELRKHKADLKARIVRVSQMMDVEMDPGSDLYKELRSLLTLLQETLGI